MARSKCGLVTSCVALSWALMFPPYCFKSSAPAALKQEHLSPVTPKIVQQVMAGLCLLTAWQQRQGNPLCLPVTGILDEFGVALMAAQQPVFAEALGV